MNTLGIVLARGGSRGVPGKNLAEVGGIPLVARAVRACRGAHTLHETIVSSDSDSILDLAEREGALTVRRPARLSGDTALSSDAIAHILESGIVFDIGALVQPTSPFVPSWHIDQCVSVLAADNTAMAAISVAESHFVLWSGQPDRPDCVTHTASMRRPGRQSDPPRWIETGGVYAFRREMFNLPNLTFPPGSVRLVPIAYWPHSVQIDEPADLTAARRLAIPS